MIRRSKISLNRILFPTASLEEFFNENKGEHVYDAAADSFTHTEGPTFIIKFWIKLFLS